MDTSLLSKGVHMDLREGDHTGVNGRLLLASIMGWGKGQGRAYEGFTYMNS